MSNELLTSSLETEIVSPGRLVIITGPTASGKSHARSLLEKRGIGRIISATTRSKRRGEKGGRDYHFMTREEFKTRIAREEFLEWNEYNNNLYGTPKSELEALFNGKHLTHATEIEGAVHFLSNVKLAYSSDRQKAQALLDNITLAFIGVDSLFTIRSRYFQREIKSGLLLPGARDTFRGRLRTDWKNWNLHKEAFDNRIIINQTGEIEDTVNQLHALFT